METVPAPLPIVDVGAPTLGGLSPNHIHDLRPLTWSHVRPGARTELFVGYAVRSSQLCVKQVQLSARNPTDACLQAA